MPVKYYTLDSTITFIDDVPMQKQICIQIPGEREVDKQFIVQWSDFCAYFAIFQHKY